MCIKVTAQSPVETERDSWAVPPKSMRGRAARGCRCSRRVAGTFPPPLSYSTSCNQPQPSGNAELGSAVHMVLSWGAGCSRAALRGAGHLSQPPGADRPLSAAPNPWDLSSRGGVRVHKLLLFDLRRQKLWKWQCFILQPQKSDYSPDDLLNGALPPCFGCFSGIRMNLSHSPQGRNLLSFLLK